MRDPANATPSTGYTTTETLHTSGRGLVYRGVRQLDGRSVILKVLSREAGPHHLERLHNEFETAGLIAGPSVVRPLAREVYQGRPAVVFEDFGGEPLSAAVGPPMEVGRFLRMALAIADCVVTIHASNIVHKDLKPANILVNPSSGEVKISDFGIAQLLPCQRQVVGNVRFIEGSLPYMSPEQTGRTNRALDQRSDLYSLGVTFYELLTGKLPLSASDPVEWVHSHVATRPTPPTAHVPDLPAGLVAVVMKLLAKEPEDRYQSAGGLRHDLAACLEQWNAGQTIARFALGQRDVWDQFQIPQRLYGREAETAALLSGFDQVVKTGAAALVLVSGYSGIGKSSLVHELQAPIVRAHGLFAWGKFDQYKRDIPYSTVVEACTQLVLEILAESEERIAAFRRAMRAALGSNGQLIVDVIPQVELVIGPQPAVPILPPAESQNRFRLLFRQFIGVFAGRQHPVAIFFDDLQWADSASLALIQDLLAEGESLPLLLVGAFRDNEVGPGHPLSLTLDRLRASGARVKELVLAPLSNAALAAFIGDVLHGEPDQVAPLVALVEEKTGGNPFFAIQFLTALHEARLIEFDLATGRWRWDVGKIHAQGFTDNVVDLMVAKLNRLAGETSAGLQRLACLGNSADLATLAPALGTAEPDVHPILAEAVRSGLVVRVGSSYKFLHDRVQEAAYSLIPSAARPELHLQIARRFAGQLSPEGMEERLFDVVNQFNRGAERISDAQERIAVFRLNLAAGTRARAAIAYASARSYFQKAEALLPADAWSSLYDETFSLHFTMAECESLLGDFAAADARFIVLLEHARDNLARARVHSLRIRLLKMAGRFAEGLKMGIAALAALGLSIPEDPDELRAGFMAEVQAVPGNLAGRRIADLVDAPVATDPEVRTIASLLIDFLPCAYNTGSPALPLVAFKVLNLCLRKGNVEEACFAYTASAFLMGAVLGDLTSGYEFSAMSLQLNRKFNDPKLRGTLIFIHAALLNFWKRPFATTADLMEQALACCLEVGDFGTVGSMAAHTVWHAFETGAPLAQVLAVSAHNRSLLKQVHDDLTGLLLRHYEQFLASLEGKTRAPASFEDDHWSEADSLEAYRQAGASAGFFIHHLMKQIATFVYGQKTESLAAANQAAALLMANLGSALEASHHFFHALALSAVYPDAPSSEQPGLMAQLQAKLAKLQHYSEHCPENFENRALLVQAEVARLEGRGVEAMQLYEQAIDRAGASGFIQNEAIASELASQFHRVQGLHRTADHLLAAARDGYARWGAIGKVRQLDARRPELREQRPLVATSTFGVGLTQMDLLSVIKASQAISGEIVLDDLVMKLVRVVIEQAGADRGYLILRKRNGRGAAPGPGDDPVDGLTLEAGAQVDDRGGVVVKLLRALPVAASPLLPASIVNYVARTKDRVLTDGAEPSKVTDPVQASKAALFASDEYISRARPKSVLCLPILRQAELVGLLYLENTLVAGAFLPEQIELLELLASQAAISIEHALVLAQEKAARLEALEALRVREEFLTVASHELRTPMTSLTLTLQTLQGKANPTAPRPKLAGLENVVDLACRQALRMNRLVSELLEVSRIQSGRLILDCVRTDLVTLAREALKRFAPDIAQAKCSVVLVGDASVVGMWDRTRLDRVIENLLSNAIKFGAGKPIEVSVTDGAGGRARLAIQDGGIGVDPSKWDHIFERFGRAVSEEHYGGLGLGLYICRRIVDAHGGTISVSSAPGQGACFTVELPRTTG